MFTPFSCRFVGTVRRHCAISHPVRALLPSAQWELWLPFGAHRGRGTRSALVWAFWTSWGSVLIWSHSAKPESCSVLLDLHISQCMGSAGRLGPGPPEGAGRFPGPAGCVPHAPHQAGRKGVTVRVPPEASPGPVLRLGPQPLMQCLPLIRLTVSFFFLFFFLLLLFFLSSLCHAGYEILVP